MNHINPWRVAETNDLKRVAQARGYTLLVLDADSSIEKQTKDVQALIEAGADYIVCTPYTYEGYGEIAQMCKDAQIPLILLDRETSGVPGVDYLTFIGSDFRAEGVMAAEYLARITNGKAKIVEIHGNIGASCTTGRSEAFSETIAREPEMEIVAFGYADYERIAGQKVMEEIILSYGTDFNAVYAHNDDMAVGAIQALKSAGMKPGLDVVLVSVDGSKDGFRSIIAGELAASVECTPKLGTILFDTIESHQRSENIPSRIIIEDRLFDASNAEELFHEGF
ncbi:MAG: substrate-binding domain-containing protein [Acholeplasmataceae bacterium]|nr:substrate-binding domain-containing protein [Acholeplasmataceae bacterium]